MDSEKIGKLICTLRKEKGLTQKSLADLLFVSDKAVSKWERCLCCPDLSLIEDLAQILNVSISTILQGDLPLQNKDGGNMKNSNFYICTNCGSINIATGNAQISCCGRDIAPLQPKKAEDNQKLSVEHIEDEWFISSKHPMQKDNYIHFVAFLKGGSMEVIKHYPEWDMQCRIPKKGHGKLIWYSDDMGLLYQLI